jgi:hypothetical protein
MNSPLGVNFGPKGVNLGERAFSMYRSELWPLGLKFLLFTYTDKLD